MARKVFDESQITEFADLFGKLFTGIGDHGAKFNDQSAAQVQSGIGFRHQTFDHLGPVLTGDQSRLGFVLADREIELRKFAFTDVGADYCRSDRTCSDSRLRPEDLLRRSGFDRRLHVYRRSSARLLRPRG